MRVAFTTRAQFISGAERSLQIMLRALPGVGVEPVVVGPPGNAFIPWCKDQGIPFLPCPLPGRDKWHPFRWWSSVHRLRGLLREHCIDLVHGNQAWSYQIAGAAARGLGIPGVCHMRDEMPADVARWFCQPGVDAVLCISRHIEQMIGTGWSAEAKRPLIRTLLNPVHLSALPGPAERATLRRQARQLLGADPDAVVFGFIGQVIPLKGLQVLLDALAGLAGRMNWQLLVAGRDPTPGAPHEQLCREQTRQLGLDDRVRFLGFLDNPEPFYHAIDLAVVPSLVEPLGRIPLEAAAFARPALAFAVGGLPDTIQHGTTGWLIPPEPEALRQGLAAFLDAPDPEAGLAARAWVEYAADPNCYAQELRRLYEQLLARKPPSTCPGPIPRRTMCTLLLSEIFPPRTGGSGRWFWEIYNRLPRDDYLLAVGEHPKQAEFDKCHDLRIVRLPLAQSAWGLRSLTGLRGYWRTFWRLRRIIKAHGVRRLHCGRALPEGWVGWLLKQWLGLPYVCYMHGEDLSCASASRELSWMLRRVLMGAEKLIANSENTKSIVCKGWQIPPERVCMLHPGMDAQRFVPAAWDLEARRELGWDARPVVLTVGRLQRRKGQDMMIRALAHIRKTIPDVLYAIVGDGEELPVLRELVAREGLDAHVQFLGEIDDARLIRCYQQCSLFVLPNRQDGQDIEGFGMVLVEAQACGKPVVAGTSGGTAETMSIPETGYVVPCEQPDQLAALVAELLSDRSRLERMGKAARPWVVEHFDWGQLVLQAKSLFAGAKADGNRLPHGDHVPTRADLPCR
jgi:phosphatidylinositol alpha-1,6-mannosyltransferase